MTLKPGDKHVDHFTWGEAEQYHTLENGDGVVVRLFEFVTLELHSGNKITGEVSYIGEKALDFLIGGSTYRSVQYQEISAIRK